MGRIFLTRTGVALQVIDGGINWDGTTKSQTEIDATVYESHFESDFYDVAGGQHELDQIEAYENNTLNWFERLILRWVG